MPRPRNMITYLHAWPLTELRDLRTRIPHSRWLHKNKTVNAFNLIITAVRFKNIYNSALNIRLQRGCTYVVLTQNNCIV